MQSHIIKTTTAAIPTAATIPIPKITARPTTVASPEGGEGDVVLTDGEETTGDPATGGFHCGGSVGGLTFGGPGLLIGGWEPIGLVPLINRTPQCGHFSSAGMAGPRPNSAPQPLHVQTLSNLGGSGKLGIRGLPGLGLPIPGGGGGCGILGGGMDGAPERGGRKPWAPTGAEQRIVPKATIRTIARQRRKRKGDLDFIGGFSGRAEAEGKISYTDP